MNGIRTRLFSLLPALAFIALAQSASAQEYHGERYYHFQSQGITSSMVEKQLGEMLRSFDPEMAICLDRPTQRLKLLTTVPLDVPEVLALAAGLGIQLQVHNPPKKGEAINE